MLAAQLAKALASLFRDKSAPSPAQTAFRQKHGLCVTCGTERVRSEVECDPCFEARYW